MSSMEFLEKLLDGVAIDWLPLGEITKYEQPTKYLVAAKNYSDEFETPVLTAGKTFILGYTNESEGIYKASENPVIIFDDFTTANKWVDFDFKAKSSAMKMITSSDETKVLLKYIYYWLNTLPSELVDGDHKRQWISTFAEKRIPIPCPDNPKKSLEIQAEIVRILDAFTELTAELTARKKQYHYYRDQLLRFKGDEVEWKALGEIGDVKMCKRILKSETQSEGDVPFYKIGTFGKQADAFISEEIYESYKSRYSFPKTGDVLISAAGTIGRAVVYDGKPAYFQDSNIVWLDNDESIVSNRYLWHCYKIVNWFVSGGGTIDRLYNDNIKKTKIPVPYPNNPEKSLTEQARIVAILDKFDALVNDLSSGLPAEIKARRQQYEHYRDKLLSFAELEATA